jgi:hypothetical protein
VANPAFDVTPARLVTGLVTERGVAPATPEGLLGEAALRRAAGEMRDLAGVALLDRDAGDAVLQRPVDGREPIRPST